MLLSVLPAGAVVLHLIALPIFLIALADNERRADRLKFGVAFLVAACATAAVIVVNRADAPQYDPDTYPHFEFPFVHWAASLLWLAVYGWFARITVQRLNDVGKSKKLAFLLLVPYVNFALATYLLFAPPQGTQRLTVP